MAARGLKPFKKGDDVRWQVGTTEGTEHGDGAVKKAPEPVYARGAVLACKRVPDSGLLPDQWHVTVQADAEDSEGGDPPPPFDINADQLERL